MYAGTTSPRLSECVKTCPVLTAIDIYYLFPALVEVHVTWIVWAFKEMSNGPCGKDDTSSTSVRNKAKWHRSVCIWTVTELGFCTSLPEQKACTVGSQFLTLSLLYKKKSLITKLGLIIVMYTTFRYNSANWYRCYLLTWDLLRLTHVSQYF